MLAADMTEIIRTLRRFTPPQKLSKLLHDHEADGSGHCPRCRTVSPCTLWVAAMAARRPR